MRGEVSRDRIYFTSGEMVNRKEILLSGWPINKKSQHLGRINAGGTNMVRKMLDRKEQEGTLWPTRK
jgi:hypothetical protein